VSIVTFSTSGGISEVWLERPEEHNAFDDELIRKLTWALGCAIGDPMARCIVVGGRGKSFSAGADLEWFKRTASFDEKRNAEEARAVALLLRTIADSPLPTIARVHGAAIGLGAGIVAACDFALATKSATFGFPDVKLGLIPAVVAPHVIEKIGAAQARRIFMTGERFDAERARELGLVHDVVKTAGQLDHAVKALIDEIVTGGPSAVAATKELVRVVSRDLDDKAKVDGDTPKRIAERRASGEGQEGIAAYIEKRKPRWAPK